MKKFFIALFAVLILGGCATKKVPVMSQAKNVTPISESSVISQKCDFVEVYTLADSHPNNVVPVLKNEAYLAGANRYLISEVTKTRRNRPSSVIAEFYRCNPHQTKKKLTIESQIKLIPGAQNVSPIAFAEVENNSCKILTTHVFKEVSSEDLEVELANQTYMLGGNRFHITKLIDTEDGQAKSVVADIYRCKHRTVNY
ncbi:hypothetical protein [Vibrio sp. VPAP30]|uniref:hypothetical protein n=1 Tax=Vibrio sp. VPAP30 TaxID=1647102 RepID=UPI0006584C30|nr:hypothetical protein [Vibrio sp. VPAP30]KLN65878.1 hypothetical protein ZX61_07560 [Vibrio sp. VPAP30]